MKTVHYRKEISNKEAVRILERLLEGFGKYDCSHIPNDSMFTYTENISVDNYINEVRVAETDDESERFDWMYPYFQVVYGKAMSENMSSITFCFEQEKYNQDFVDYIYKVAGIFEHGPIGNWFVSTTL